MLAAHSGSELCKDHLSYSFSCFAFLCIVVFRQQKSYGSIMTQLAASHAPAQGSCCTTVAVRSRHLLESTRTANIVQHIVQDIGLCLV